MGMAVTVEVVDDRPAAVVEGLLDDVFRWLRTVDELFSTYLPGSEVSRLGRGELAVGECSADVRTVVERCAELWRVTDGYFDAYATGRLDPSGYVKGWAVQVASDRLLAAGAVNHCINAGGDVRVRGTCAPGQPWRVGLRHPFEPLSVYAVLVGADLAVATSGTYERGFHVVDPHRGVPARDLCSVTVVGSDLGLADAYATAALAMGLPGLDWLAHLAGHESAAVTADGRSFRSDGLPVDPPEIGRFAAGPPG
ncbi:MAG TPA: FAD:protein FMN transferase [Micromonosporaceae bacterium]|nr:FAD:protein FMN transferase [Micromonosporaceae bacterium]